MAIFVPNTTIEVQLKIAAESLEEAQAILDDLYLEVSADPCFMELDKVRAAIEEQWTSAEDGVNWEVEKERK
jgi:hypothetical protein